MGVAAIAIIATFILMQNRKLHLLSESTQHNLCAHWNSFQIRKAIIAKKQLSSQLSFAVFDALQCPFEGIRVSIT
jgi:hypothetical protein